MGFQEWLKLVLIISVCYLYLNGNSLLHGRNKLKQDAQALLEVKAAMADSDLVLGDWAGDNPCSWAGVGCRNGRVVSLSLHHPGLTGPVLPAIARLSELEFLEVDSSSLSGPLPPGLLPSLPALRRLKLRNSRLAGGLDALFGDFLAPPHHLVLLDLSGNFLSGPIPDGFLARLPRLRHLALGNNNLVGGLAALFGSVEAGASAGKELEELDLSGNHLSGPIPLGLSSCKRLASINLEGNSLEAATAAARIPDTTGLYLHFPKPNVSAPASASIVHLGWKARLRPRSRHSRAVRLQEAPGPATPVSPPASGPGSADPPSPPAPGPGTADSESPPPAPGTEAAAPGPLPRRKQRSAAQRWGLGLALGLVAGAVAAAMVATLLRFLLYLRRKPDVAQGPITFNKIVNPKMLASLLEPDALQDAEQLGQGASGQVFKAVLQPGDLPVAIKLVAIQRAESGPADGDRNGAGSPMRSPLRGRGPRQGAERRQIQSELESLGAIRHRNLVGLLAYVARQEDHLLVYEFMENGSLHSALSKAATGELVMDWPCRLRIAQGTAAGLEYLHVECRPKVVHRDIKPGNILLDDKFEPHIGDFGLAKMLQDGRTHASATNVAGTLGFIAPEYHQTSKFSPQSDIYSFGITMAALFTGKLPSSPFFDQEFPEGLPSWLVYLAREEKLDEAIDPRLRDGGRLTPDQEREAVLALKLVLVCLSADPSRRPSASEVVKAFGQISGRSDGQVRRGIDDLIAPEPVRNPFGSSTATVVPRDSSSSTSNSKPSS